MCSTLLNKYLFVSFSEQSPIVVKETICPHVGDNGKRWTYSRYMRELHPYSFSIRKERQIDRINLGETPSVEQDGNEGRSNISIESVILHHAC